MQAILFALLSYIGWGVGDIFGVIASKKIGGYSATFWSFAARAIVLTAYLPFIMNDIRHLTIANTLFTILLSFLFIIGSILFFKACNGANVSLVGAIGAAYAVPAIIISVIFLHETIMLPQAAAVGIILIGLVLSSVELQVLRQKKVFLEKGVLLVLVTVILWGIYFSFIKIPVKEIGWFLPNYFIYLLAPFILLIMKVKKVKLQYPTQKKTILGLIFYTLLATMGNFAYNIGITNGFVSVVAPIAGAYPTIFVILSFLIFKDKITPQQLVGIIISLIGIVMLSFLSI